jgi:hypothetical protein
VSPSGSFPVNVIAFGVSSGVKTDWGFATGGSFTAVTVIVTVAGAEVSEPSLTVNVKLSGPLKLRLGVYVTLGALPVSDPLEGPLAIAQVIGFPSGSLPVSVIAIGVSSGVVTA